MFILDFLRNWLANPAHQETILFFQLSAVNSITLIQLLYYKRLTWYSALGIVIILLRGQFLVRLPQAMGLDWLSDVFDSYMFRSPFYALAVVFLYIGYVKMKKFHGTMEKLKTGLDNYAKYKEVLDNYLETLDLQHNSDQTKENL